MKVFLVFLLVLGLTLLLAALFGWRNLGNQPPVVPQKLIAMGQAEPEVSSEASAPEGVTTELKASLSCAHIVAQVQQGQPINAELDWLSGYLNANNKDAVIAPAQLQHAALRTLLLAFCAEFPNDTLEQAAARVLTKLKTP